MKDNNQREIDYLRVSITDRCNLRCKYCMPQGIEQVSHQDILRFEEFLHICKVAATLGIKTIKVTGGEPLVRKGAVNFMKNLKGIEGIQQVTLTTNGVILDGVLEELVDIGVHRINVSLDTLNRQKYTNLTGKDALDNVLKAIRHAVDLGVHVKINTVLLKDSAGEISELASMAAAFPIDVRFIELMPIGEGNTIDGLSAKDALMILKKAYPDLETDPKKRGFGPAHYYKSSKLIGSIGLIDAISHSFCADCNRLRLTSTGELKPCLCYGEGVDLRGLVRAGVGDEVLKKAIKDAILSKPKAHRFTEKSGVTESKKMSQIGG